MRLSAVHTVSSLIPLAIVSERSSQPQPRRELESAEQFVSTQKSQLPDFPVRFKSQLVRFPNLALDKIKDV
ncbi:hypothetical protein Hypma_008310 [Hypsizygus marmoreus]|uniref:Uncharacterized protein n=1 Tax=Hypsizygus marmoreus TaxID=39966 RepID=A0A369JT39_HYPMA|nr:hypothetical protein Hypma_008310 [Hypsizygus marmoreus]